MRFCQQLLHGEGERCRLQRLQECHSGFVTLADHLRLRRQESVLKIDGIKKGLNDRLVQLQCIIQLLHDSDANLLLKYLREICESQPLLLLLMETNQTQLRKILLQTVHSTFNKQYSQLLLAVEQGLILIESLPSCFGGVEQHLQKLSQLKIGNEKQSKIQQLHTIDNLLRYLEQQSFEEQIKLFNQKFIQLKLGIRYLAEEMEMGFKRGLQRMSHIPQRSGQQTRVTPHRISHISNRHRLQAEFYQQHSHLAPSKLHSQIETEYKKQGLENYPQHMIAPLRSSLNNLGVQSRVTAFQRQSGSQLHFSNGISSVWRT